jgi:probable rRNA maturation factor
VAEVEVLAEVQIAPAFAKALSEDHLQAVAKEVLRHEGRSGQVTLVITDDRGIQELNRDFVGIDAPTDVLAFSAQEGDSSFVAAPGAGGYLGDVIVSYPRAVVQAEEMGHSLELEINLLVVHGLLHLLGYDHGDEAAKALMWVRQEEILRSLQVRGDSQL